MRVARYRNCCFATLWTGKELVGIAVPDPALAAEIRKHAHVEVAGALSAEAPQRSPGDRLRSRIEVRHLKVNAAPSARFTRSLSSGRSPYAGICRQIANERDKCRSLTTALRDLAFVEAEEFLRRSGSRRIIPPIVRGGEAAAGSTQPFRVFGRGRTAYLPVASLDVVRRAVAATRRPTHTVAPLFWNHRYSGTLSLNEISLIEFGIPADDLDSTMRTVLGMLARVADLARRTEALCASVVDAIAARLSSPVPVLPYAEAMAHVVKEGLTESHARFHELPRRFDSPISDWLGSDVYWLVDSPGETNPPYVQLDASGRGRDCELRVLGTGAIASGGVWTPIGSQDRPAGVGSGDVEPSGTGMSLGLDRFLAALLGQKDLRGVVQFPVRGRRLGVFTSPPHVDVEIEDHEPPSVGRGCLEPVSWPRAAGLSRRLRDLGFGPLQSPYLTSRRAPVLVNGDTVPIEVDYFGARVSLRRELIGSHVLAAACDRYDTYEIGPVFGRDSEAGSSPVNLIVLTVCWRVRSASDGSSIGRMQDAEPWVAWLREELPSFRIDLTRLENDAVPSFLRSGVDGRPPAPARIDAVVDGRNLSGWFGTLALSERSGVSPSVLGPDAECRVTWEALADAAIPPLGCLVFPLATLTSDRESSM